MSGLSALDVGGILLKQPALTRALSANFADIQAWQRAQATTTEPSTENYSDLPLGPDMGAVWDSIPRERREELERDAEGLVQEHTGRDGLTHRDVGDILLDMKEDNSVTDIEQAYMWTFIANNKATGGLSPNDGEWQITTEGARPEVIDSWPGNSGGTAEHTVVGFDDGYHGTLGGTAGDNGRAETEIAEHEEWKWDPFNPNIFERVRPGNPGDENASLAMVDSFRAFREGGFDAFADTWIENMVAEPEHLSGPPTGTTTTTTPPATEDHSGPVPTQPQGSPAEEQSPSPTRPGPPTGTTTTTTPA